MVDKQSRRERKKEEMRNKILQAAETLYHDKALAEVSMEDISEKADISRVTLYNYFSNQGCIVLSIGISNMQEIQKKQADQQIGSSTGYAQICGLFQGLMTSFLENPLDHKIWHYFLSLNNLNAPAEGDEMFETLMVGYLSQLRSLETIWLEAINLGVQDGSIRNDHDPEQLVHYLFTLLSGLVNTFEVEKFQLEKVNLGQEMVSQMTLELIGRFLTVS